jgi:hypothetical protein
VLDGSVIESFFAAEIVRDGGLVNSGAFGELPGGSAFEVISAKDLSGGV